MAYFSSPSSAERYARFRPKVHAVALDWLAAATGPRRYRKALDIACGTGDSTQALLSIADSVEGVDSSDEMLAQARLKGLHVHNAPFDALPPGKYDLLSVCMAFHWFDRSRALQVFANASANSATWLIYNFAFAGHATDGAFNEWLRTWYAVKFPSPGRAAPDFRVSSSDANLVELAHGSGVLPIKLDRAELLGYFTTQSNVEARVQAGYSYADLEREMDASMPAIETPTFQYAYSYTVASFTKLQAVAV